MVLLMFLFDTSLFCSILPFFDASVHRPHMPRIELRQRHNRNILELCPRHTDVVRIPFFDFLPAEGFFELHADQGVLRDGNPC